jgi:hypothetical protein
MMLLMMMSDNMMMSRLLYSEYSSTEYSAYYSIRVGSTLVLGVSLTQRQVILLLTRESLVLRFAFDRIWNPPDQHFVRAICVAAHAFWRVGQDDDQIIGAVPFLDLVRRLFLGNYCVVERRV